MNQKIKSVRFYQAVYINNTPETYVRAPEHADLNRRDGKDKSKLTLHERGLLIENENETILVGWPNIGSMQFEKSISEESKDSKSSKKDTKEVDFRKL